MEIGKNSQRKRSRFYQLSYILNWKTEGRGVLGVLESEKLLKSMTTRRFAGSSGVLGVIFDY